MPSVLFVHGSGVRARAYAQTESLVREALVARRPDVTIESCNWGEDCGARLHREGVSMPEWTSRTNLEWSPGADEYNFWALLYDDPLIELRFLVGEVAEGTTVVPGHMPRRQRTSAAFDKLLAAEGVLAFTATLRSARLEGIWRAMIQSLPSARAWSMLLQQLDENRNESLDALARALVAQLIAIAGEEGAPIPTAELRDALVAYVASLLGSTTEGRSAWASRRLRNYVVSAAAQYATRRTRGELRIGHAISADLLLYQTRGERIRAMITDWLREMQHPVIVLGHGLGGVIATDVLAATPHPQVSTLITVGSQVGLLYELDCLVSLRAGDDLPSHMPAWLNIFDHADPSSSLVAPLFADRAVRDLPIASHQPIAVSHRAYWTNRALWDAIVSEIA